MKFEIKRLDRVEYKPTGRPSKYEPLREAVANLKDGECVLLDAPLPLSNTTGPLNLFFSNRLKRENYKVSIRQTIDNRIAISKVAR